MKIDIPVRHIFEIDIDMDEVFDAIHEMPLSKRINLIASLINGIDDESGIEDVTNDHKQLIYNWLNRQLPKYKI